MSEARLSDPEAEQVHSDAAFVVGSGSTEAGPGGVFFAAVQLTPAPMIVVDPRRPDSPIVFANRAFAAATGYAADEIVGRSSQFLQGAETDPETLRALREAIGAGREIAVEILFYRKDGRGFWTALSLAPVFDDGGGLRSFVGTMLAAGRHRDAEATLGQVRKSDELGSLAGGIAHDFNNFLQVIVGYLDLVKSGLGKPDIQRDRLTRSIDNARAAADRAIVLTQTLLARTRAAARERDA